MRETDQRAILPIGIALLVFGVMSHPVSGGLLGLGGAFVLFGAATRRLRRTRDVRTANHGEPRVSD